MEPLIQLIKAIREAKNFDEWMRHLEELITRVRPELRAYIFRVCRPEVADDICQETLVAIVEGHQKVNAKKDKQFWSWCYHVVRNKLCDQVRRQKTDPTALSDTEELEREFEASTRDEPLPPGERLDLEDAMKMLKHAKPPCYELLWKHYIVGWEYAEIALELGLKYDTAKRRIDRCLELAQSLLGKKL